MKKKMEIPIEATASFVSDSSIFYYIRHIFYALREHMDLLDKPDYKRLYDEAIDHLFRYAVAHSGWNKDKRKWGYSNLELLADLYNSHHNEDKEKFSIGTVDSLLGLRRKVWNDE